MLGPVCAALLTFVEDPARHNNPPLLLLGLDEPCCAVPAPFAPFAVMEGLRLLEEERLLRRGGKSSFRDTILSASKVNIAKKNLKI